MLWAHCNGQCLFFCLCRRQRRHMVDARWDGMTAMKTKKKKILTRQKRTNLPRDERWEFFFFFILLVMTLSCALESMLYDVRVCYSAVATTIFFFCSCKLHVERLSPYQLRLLINAFLRWHEFKRSNERARMYRCSPPKRSGTSSTCNRAERLCSIIRRVNTELCWRRAHLPDMLCAERTFRTCICSSSAIDSDPKWQSSRCMSETTPTYVSPVIPIVDFPQINIQLRSGMHHLMWRYTVHSYNATSNVFNN